MPDRYGNTGDDLDDPTDATEIAQAARDADLAARHADLELAAQARATCTLCDPDGYRLPERAAVCDHVDHAPAARRGIEACRAALAKEHTR